MSISKLERALVATLVLGLALASGAASANPAAASAYNMPEGVTPISHWVYGLHMHTFWICVGIAVVVFGAMLISIIFHRKSRGAVAANFHENIWIEMGWTIVPVIILVIMAVPAVDVLVKMEDYSKSDMSIKVTGYQWMWNYDYINNGISFYSKLGDATNRARMANSDVSPSSVKHYLREVDHPLVVPTGKKIRLLLTSGDVIHSWWVPDFGAKTDAIPGYVNQLWIKVEKPGIYRGQCAELCGRGHAYMPIVVVAKTPDEFRAWVKAQGGHLAKGPSTGGTTINRGRQPAPDAVQPPPRNDSGANDDGAAPAEQN
ncbi:MAG TPA: cytochrome c oxidase subunit II [Gammaproteobacteria bacterium]|jgi:cytochrome c oxidase subunit 2|nr:cytochrome c oxidase subunit II [Gammaproteobacteria bacterium]